MDDFVTEVENIKKESIPKSKMRSLLCQIFNSINPTIHITEKCSEDGDVKFTIPLEYVGISGEDLAIYRNEIFSTFFSNFVGELLVRENINIFVDILTQVDIKDYHSVVNKYNHQRCGLSTSHGKFAFSFHISLVQSIVNEDLNIHIRQGL